MSFHRLGFLLALPTVVGLSLAACGTEDDAAPAPTPGGGTGQTAGTGGTETGGGNGGTSGNGATGGGTNPEGGVGGEPGPSEGGAGGDSAGGAAGSGGDGASSAGDGNSAGAGGEGGQPGPVACHTILANFDADPGGAMGRYVVPSSGPVASSTVEWSSTEGVTAAGAGKLNATFGAFSEKAQLSLYFPAGTHWTCKTKLHAKVKLVAANNIAHINGVNMNINSGSSARYSLQFTSTTDWTMDTWYSIELPFATATYQNPANTLPDFDDVNSIGVMVEAKSDGLTPVPTMLYVDDVWLE